MEATMLHAISASATADVPTLVDASHPDAELLALAPALESAMREREAFDRELDTRPGDPDAEENYARRKALTLAADEAAQRILAHRPKTAAGLLLIAHAAAAEADYLWDPAETDLDSAERGLRAVCDGLFTLVGVDWRGRPLAGAAAAPQPMASPDPIFGMIEVSRIALDAHAAALAAPDAMTPAGWARTAPAARAAREAWTALLTVTPTTAAGVTALARHATDQAARGDGLEADDLLAVLGTIGAAKLECDPTLAARGETMRTDPATDAQSAPATPEPLFVALEAHRSAHCEWLATLEGDDDEVVQKALSRRDAAFKAVLAVRPMSDAGRLAYAKHVLFEFAQIGIGSEIPPDLVIEAARMLNGWWSVSPTAMPPVAIEPTGAEAALHAALDAHLVAYAHRLHSATSAASDADARADDERRAFRNLLHMPLGTDGARVAYATAILGQACSVYGAECDALDRSSPLPTAYRNLAFGQHAPEPQASDLLAAE
ncbi:hypothetical protein FV218_15160 [Methylobacterium sp. WL69]|uniref:hypothetical protein n=1 Tax=Methylobacterium sp. WL69 TaxID=2603893 RepID=UPI0011C8DAF2|nr:hypothetical protein [Methylobacterium sp. WL69]TXM71470.1 hypothetical protein FV218_15160 [Methylobacterium sp. WL69]